MIVAGGTGGHIFPALALARVLRERGFDLRWLGSHVGMESKLVGNEFQMTFISVKAVRGKRWFSRLISVLRFCVATWHARLIIKKQQPSLVLGMGGFVSGAGGLAARWAGVPLIIHEQNAIAGMTNRLLSRYAQIVLQGFPKVFPSKISAKTVGNPVRPAINALVPPRQRLKNRKGPLRILVMGGSQGASAINQAIVSLMSDYSDCQQLEVWHQTGHLDFEKVKRTYRAIAVSATIDAFIDKVDQAYAWADLLIGRAGALTIAEIMAAGLASILIPLPCAADDHQYANGHYLAQAGAAELIRQNDLTTDQLHHLIKKYITDREVLIDMAERARALAKPNALSDIANICQRLIETS